MQAKSESMPDFRTQAGLIEFVHGVWPDFSITAENLRQPTEEFVLEFCVNWLNHFQPQTQFLFEMTPEQRNLTDNPEIYAFTIHVINIYKMTMQYLTALNCSRIQGILDFISPTCKTVRPLIRFAANFSSFHNIFCDEYNEKMKTVREKATKNEELRNEIDRLKTVLHNKRLEKIEIKNLSIQKERENVKVEEKIQRQSKLKLKLSQKIDALKASHESANSKYEKITSECQKLENKNAHLRKQIMDYPQKQEQLKSLQEIVNELDLKTEEVKKIYQTRENNMATIESLSQIYEKCLEKIDEVRIFNDELSVLEKKRENYQVTVQNLTKDLNETERKKEITKSVIVKLEHDLEEIKKLTITEEKMKERNVLLAKLKEIQLTQKTLKLQCDALRKKKLEEEKHIVELQQEFDTKKDGYTAYYEKILLHVNNSSKEKKRRMAEVLNNIKEKLKESD